MSPHDFSPTGQNQGPSSLKLFTTKKTSSSGVSGTRSISGGGIPGSLLFISFSELRLCSWSGWAAEWLAGLPRAPAPAGSAAMWCQDPERSFHQAALTGHQGTQGKGQSHFSSSLFLLLQNSLWAKTLGWFYFLNHQWVHGNKNKWSLYFIEWLLWDQT